MDSKELVKSLRKIADFYEAHPDIYTPCVDKFYVFLSEKDQLVEVARALGKCEKGADDNYFYLKKTFGSLQVEFNLSRGKACRRVVVGKRTVAEKVIPAQVIAAHEEDVVEWHCDPVLKGSEPELIEAGVVEAVALPEASHDDIPF